MRRLFFLLVFLPVYLQAQVSDDFSDGNFTSNPRWSGDSAQFKINSGNQLQLFSSGESVSCLSTYNALMDSTEWIFWIKMPFDPSNQNFARIYLISDHSDLKTNLNGYFLQFGENGTADAIQLFRQNGTTQTSVCRGKDSLIAHSFTLRIKVTRSRGGAWKIFADPSGGTNFIEQASGTDNTFVSTSFFGVYCKYTSSNSTKFFFDDFLIRNIQPDNSPPEIVSANAIRENKLGVLFDEPVERTSAQTITNFSVDKSIGNPILAEISPENPALVILTFGENFTPNLTYTLSITNIKDLSGNILAHAEKTFGYYVAHQFDVLINEIMADPNPPVNLPDFEYLELYNRSDIPVDLTGWQLDIGLSQKYFPSSVIPSQGFLIVGNVDAEPFLKNYGAFIGFTGFALTNTGTTVTLKNQEGKIIHSVSYTDDWYRDNSKKDGGWSLELIDPMNPCGESGNWKASASANGGTPGSVNSVLSENPDNMPPEIAKISLPDSTTLGIYFTEPMDSLKMNEPSVYFIDQSIGNPAGISLSHPDFRSVTLHFLTPFQRNTIYHITISDTLFDCAGNALIQNTSARFAIPSAVASNDIVINEILSNPKDDGVDFVEIYNRSTKIINLKELIISSLDTLASTLKNVCPITAEGYLLFPSEYIALTTNPEKVKEQYFTTNPKGFIPMNSFPPFNDNDGIVVLATKGQTTIDRFHYYKGLYYPLLNSTDGVSLERISFDRPTEDATNWHSAAETAGFATPAYQNSQFMNYPPKKDNITILPEIFSPDNDGYNDVLNIIFSFDDPGYVANITIYDSRGRLVRNLVKNKLLGTSGSFSWDGINENSEKASIGIYIIYLGVFDLKGKVKHYKKTAVLGGKL